METGHTGLTHLMMASEKLQKALLMILALMAEPTLRAGLAARIACLPIKGTTAL